MANAYATRELYLDATTNKVKHFVYLSTFHIYGKKSGIIDENTVPDPISDYGLSHYFAEQYLKQLSKQSNCKVTILRLTNGMGVPLSNENKWYLVMNDLTKMAYEHKKIELKSNGLPLRDFISMKDVASAIYTIMKSPENKPYSIFNISSEKTYSIRDIALKIYEHYLKRYNSEIMLSLPEITQSEINIVKPLTVLSKKLRSKGWDTKFNIDDVVSEMFDYFDNKNIGCK